MPLLTLRPKETRWNQRKTRTQPLSPHLPPPSASEPVAPVTAAGSIDMALSTSIPHTSSVPVLSLPGTPSSTFGSFPYDQIDHDIDNDLLTPSLRHSQSAVLIPSSGPNTLVTPPRLNPARNLSVIMDCSPPAATPIDAFTLPKSSTIRHVAPDNHHQIQRTRHVSDSHLALKARQQAAALAVRSPSSDMVRTHLSASNLEIPSGFDHPSIHQPSQLRRRASQLVDLITIESDPERRRLRADLRPSILARWRSSRMFNSFSRSSVSSISVERTDQPRSNPDSRQSGDTNAAPPSEHAQSLDGRHLTPTSNPPTSHATTTSDGSILNSPIDNTAASPPAPNSTPTVKSTTPRSWLSWKGKRNAPLFTLPTSRSSVHGLTAPTTPRASTSAASAGDEHSPLRPSIDRSVASSVTGSRHRRMHSTDRTASPFTRSSVGFTSGNLLRHGSNQSGRSGASSPTLAPYNAPPIVPRFRRRSSTMGSNGLASDDGIPPTSSVAGLTSGRTSLSTATGRSSFSNLFSLNRLRHGSESHSLFGTANSTSEMQAVISSSNISLPPRQEAEAFSTYITRIQDQLPFCFIASLASRQTDEFHKGLLRAYMSKFAFFGEPIDMAIRKLLLHAELPKETQQIDRVLQSFSDRYHECNPGIFPTNDLAYFVTFSILILQTDVFNKNNKCKMSRPAYIKNSSIDGISEDVLACIYDNIVYTPFIRVEDELDSITTSKRARRRRKVPAVSVASLSVTGPGNLTGPRIVASSAPVGPAPARPLRRPTKEPLDPYTLIFEARLDMLRPPLKDVLTMDDPYTYINPNHSPERRKGVVYRPYRSGVLQIESARSRPDAFMSPTTINNPDDSRVGLVDIPVEKIGVLWRKGAKRKTGRSPWQEWGAMLTGQGLCLFRNVAWIKNLMHQHDSHVKHFGDSAGPVVFTPAIADFKPDALLSTQDCAILLDTEYKRHKHAFLFVRATVRDEEVFLAENDADLNAWLFMLNRQAAFKTAGIQFRGDVGNSYGDQRSRSIQTTVPVQSQMDHKLAYDISVLRQAAMTENISQWEESLASAIRELDTQLRDARHLSIMSPIQPKTRDLLMQSAARLAERIKWKRFHIWRLKCHRDTLARELETEKMVSLELVKNVINHSTSPSIEDAPEEDYGPNTNLEDTVLPSSPTVLVPSLSSISLQSSHTNSPSDSQHSQTSMKDIVAPESDSAIEQRTPTAIGLSLETSLLSPPSASGRLTPQSQIRRSTEVDFTTDDGFFTPLNQSPIQSPASIATVRLPSAPSRDSFADGVESHPSESTAEYLSADSGSEAPTPNLPGSPILRKRRSAAQSTVASCSTDNTNASGKMNVVTSKSSTTSSHGHRSISRTFRHSREGPLKWKNNKIREASTTDSSNPDQEIEGLIRAKGSFTVHGKKASVITFGSEWHGMSAEERLKARKASQVIDLDEHGFGRPTSSIISLPVQEEEYVEEDYGIPCTDEIITKPGQLAALHSLYPTLSVSMSDVASTLADNEPMTAIHDSSLAPPIIPAVVVQSQDDEVERV